MIPKSKKITNTPEPTKSSLKQTIPKLKQILTTLKPTTTSKKLTKTPASTAVEPSTKATHLFKPSAVLRSTSTSSILPAPATTRSHELKMRSNVSARRTHSEDSLQSSIAAKNLLNKLKSTDSNTKILGIQILIERLKETPYTSPKKSPLPTNVPKKIDLLPLLMDFLSRKNLKTKVYEKLMSWDCIAGIFVRTLSIRNYCPTLIIADEQKKCQNLDDKEIRVFNLYSQGLKRVKMFLKRNDSMLAFHLLIILKSVMSADQKVLNATVKHDLRMNASYQPSLELGLLKWMNELIQDYVGLPQDEDEELLKEGSKWLTTESDEASAEQWFELPTNIQTYTEFVIEQLLQTQEEDNRFGILCSMLRSLKMGNVRVFESRMKALDEHQVEQITTILSSNKSYLEEENEVILPEQHSAQKRKRESPSLEFSVEAAGDSDDEEERNRKNMKLEHTPVSPGVEPLELETFEFDSFMADPYEVDALEGMEIDSKAVEDEVIKDEVAESKVMEEKVIKDKVVEDKVVEEKVVEEKVVESKVLEEKVIEAEVTEEKVVEAEVSEEKVVEEKSVETKPVEEKSVEAEVIEAKVSEAMFVKPKPVEFKPVKTNVMEPKVVEKKPVESKGTEDKVVENKSSKIEFCRNIVPTTDKTETTGPQIGTKRKAYPSLLELPIVRKQRKTYPPLPELLQVGRKQKIISPSVFMTEKKSINRIEDEVDQTSFLDKFLADPKNVDDALLQRILEFSKATRSNIEVWMQKKKGIRILFLLIRSLRKVIGNQDSSDNLRLNAVNCIKELLSNQRKVLDKIDSVNVTVIYSLARALVKNVKDYNKVN